MLRKFPKSKLICRIDMSGFLSIMFFFVFLFIASSPIICGGRSVDLPKAISPTAESKSVREDAIIIAVARDGKIFCGNNRMLPDRLHTCIRDAVIKGSEPKIYIRADARARYGAVVDVLNVVRESEIQDIAFLAEQRPIKSAAQ